jgi:thiosulfate reductase cytochrome b subunit
MAIGWAIGAARCVILGLPFMPRHSIVVRITHWLTALSFVSLLVSGIAILLAHPRLYWGETGNLDTASLLDLPLPFILNGQSGWGRYLHFQSAWLSVLTGMVYVVHGVASAHLRKDLVQADSRKPDSYNPLQRVTYLTVVFIAFPLMIWTGLAMSPAVTSVLPVLVTVWGGQQSARTIHFFLAAFLVLFLLIHVVMVWRAGFSAKLWPMILGRRLGRQENS